MLAPLVFIDTETTGLRPGYHEMYELAMIKVGADATIFESHRWIAPEYLDRADAGALQVGRYYERNEAMRKDSGIGYVETKQAMMPVYRRSSIAREISEFTAGAFLVGANPAFDAAFVEAFLRDNNAAPSWNHRLIDVRSMAIPLLPELEGRPVGLSDLLRILDLEISDDERHTATGDARAALDVYNLLIESGKA